MLLARRFVWRVVVVGQVVVVWQVVAWRNGDGWTIAIASSGTNGFVGDSWTGGRLMVCDEEPQVGAGSSDLETPPNRELLDSHFSHSASASNRKSPSNHHRAQHDFPMQSQYRFQCNPNTVLAAILADRLVATPWRACICSNISAPPKLRLSDVQKAGNVVHSKPFFHDSKPTPTTNLRRPVRLNI